MSTSSLFLAAVLVASTSGQAGAPTPSPAAVPAKLAASEVAEEVDAVRVGAKALQADAAALVARKGANPERAAASLALSVAELRKKDVAQFKSATETAPKQITLSLEKLDKQLLAFSGALDAIPRDRPLCKGDADSTGSSSKRVMDDIDSLFALIEPVVHR